ncbi:hypothetical protein ACI7RC_08445 [Brevibacillus sp. B_LB10_24]|uniref:hypothetical protein n=1 Tax=Brevibacillus sp. B_LB10_24 TaxID=3380645 RepID=UPI0038BB4C24
MKRAGLVLVFVFALMIGTACKPKTIEQAMERDVPFQVNKLIKQIQLEGNKRLVFYTLNAEVNYGDIGRKIDDILNAAIFKGNPEEGWEFLGAKGWNHYTDDDMEVYDSTIHYQENQETKDIAVMFGRIHNPDIATVDVGNEETGYIQANLFEADGIRYFYRVYSLDDLRWEHKGTPREGEAVSIGAKGFHAKGISKDGEVLK